MEEFKVSPAEREIIARLAARTARRNAAANPDLQADVLRRTLAQIDCSGLRAALARQDRTRGWLA